MIVLGMFNFNRKQVVHVLNNYGIKVTIFDPLANTEEVMHEYGLECHSELGIVNPRPQSGVEGLGDRTLTATSLRASESERSNHINTAHTKNPTVNPRSLSGVEGLGGEEFDAIVLGVAHKQFLNMDLDPLKKDVAVVYDVKGVLENADMKL